ncbi:glycosyltransferase [Actinomadura sp. SCN-SB]|uniref:glycosyltransferase n=1 Tax=Actinomadura sp. SCN-SB TaxID=3373092 RepID=UPI003752EE71
MSRRVRVPSLLGEDGTLKRPTPPRREGDDRRRFLFTVPPLPGHVAPTVAVGAELARRGHKVAWAGHRATLERLLRRGSMIFTAEDDALGPRLERARREWLGLRGPAALRFLWEELIVPLGEATLPGARSAIKRFHPDVVVSDQHALAGAVAARSAGLPWATSAVTSAEFARPLAALPRVEEWVRDVIGDFQAGHGIGDPLDPRFSDHLVLAFTTGGLIGDTSVFPDHFAFVGPVRAKPSGGDFPWPWLDEGGDRPVVLVDLGETDGPAGERFCRTAAEAVRGLDARAVVVAPPRAVPEPPGNVLVRERVPRSALLKRASAVVTLGDHGLVCEALADGVPLVVAPVRADQPVVAGQVAGAGAGVTVRYGRVRTGELRSALGAVLDDPGFADAAARVGASFTAAGGAAEAADRLEKLA